MIDDVIKMNDFLTAEGAEDWRILSDGAVAFYKTDSLAMSANFVAALTDVADLGGHQFGIDIRQDGVTVRVVTLRDDLMGMTRLDLELARAIQSVARGMELQPDPSRLQSILIIPGAPNRSEVMPFWRAALGYIPRPDSPHEDLIDPHDRGVALWFEEMDEPRADGQGAIHVAVWLPYEVAQARVNDTLAAGGRMVRDDFAPAWWTLADKYGNEIDIATVKYRDEEPPSGSDAA
jgi:4a-hydroxytetrahydrobiopterin dehydratase